MVHKMTVGRLGMTNMVWFFFYNFFQNSGFREKKSFIWTHIPFIYRYWLHWVNNFTKSAPRLIQSIGRNVFMCVVCLSPLCIYFFKRLMTPIYRGPREKKITQKQKDSLHKSYESKLVSKLAILAHKNMFVSLHNILLWIGSRTKSPTGRNK